VKKRQWR